MEDEEKPSSRRGQPRRQRPLVLLGVVALLVGLLGGFIAGFRVEQNRVWNREAKTKTPTLMQTPQKISRVGGVVTDAANGKITVAASTGFQLKMGLPSTLVVEKATKGSIADVTVGSGILQRSEPVSKGNEDASEIIVVPRGSKFKGLTVTAVTGDKISAAQPYGEPLVLTVKPTTAIYKLHRSSANDIAKGAELLANGEGALGRDTFDPNAMIILPPGSAFRHSSSVGWSRKGHRIGRSGATTRPRDEPRTSTSPIGLSRNATGRPSNRTAGTGPEIRRDPCASKCEMASVISSAS